ncbi:MAG TPA: hypothetical protein PLK52_04500, partial [Usitatibacteraceae bacterium]|nr:hypothetical protein [Usitatibacteraceae bacterium]
MTLRASLIVTWHAPEPVQAPLQCVNAWRGSVELGVSVTTCPLGNGTLHAPGQSMPAGAERTFAPRPALTDTESVKFAGTNVAVTLFA